MLIENSFLFLFKINLHVCGYIRILTNTYWYIIEAEYIKKLKFNYVKLYPSSRHLRAISNHLVAFGEEEKIPKNKFLQISDFSLLLTHLYVLQLFWKFCNVIAPKGDAGIAV